MQTIFKSTKRAANEVYGKKAAHNGWVYNMSKGYETTEGMRYYWRCETKKCPACIKTNVNYDILAIKEEHNHQKLDPEVLKATIARSEMLASVAVSCKINFQEKILAFFERSDKFFILSRHYTSSDLLE